MTIYIHGTGQLAAAIRTCCDRWFRVISDPAQEHAIFWICEDTPVNSLDESNVDAILDEVRPLLAALPATTLVLISSQLPVGTTARLEKEFPALTFACSPENIRVKTGVQDFENQARIVVGGRSTEADMRLVQLFSPFTGRFVYVGTETAECVKHAMNGYLAVCIAYINEVATICRQVGADPDAVAACLKLDRRVSPQAPLTPGAPYSAGTLARDVFTMARLGGALTPLIGSVKKSNDRPVR